MSDFPKGFFFKKPHDNAPDFVKGSMNIKREDAIRWLQDQSDEWVTLDCKVSREGKGYCQVNDWKPGQSPAQGHSGSQQAADGQNGGDFDSDIPFMRLDGRAY